MIAANRALVQAASVGMTRARITTVDFTQLGNPALSTLTAAAIGEKLTLNLFDGVTLVAVREKLQRNALGSYTWIGQVAGLPLSQAIFVVRDGALYGGIQAPGIGEFAIQPLDRLTHVIQQAGPNTILPEDDTHTVEDEHDHADHAGEGGEAQREQPAQPLINHAAAAAGSFGARVFAHELGHNMGSRHDWYMDGCGDNALFPRPRLRRCSEPLPHDYGL